MSKVFGSIAIVVLIATSFFAWRNMTALQQEAGDKSTNKEGRIQIAKSLEVSTTQELKTQRLRLADATTQRDEHVNSEAQTATQLAQATGQQEEAKEKIKDLNAQKEDNATQITEAKDILSGLPDPDTLIPRINSMRNELSATTADISSQEARLANLVQKDKQGKERIAQTREQMSYYTSGKSLPTLKGKIRSVHRNWGFVIINAGNKQGVVSGSTLDVVRDGEIIAKLKVTAVEEGLSSANIIPESLSEGVSLSQGDSVIPESSAEKS